MKFYSCVCLALAFILVACSGAKEEEQDPQMPVPSDKAPVATVAETGLPVKAPIDPGDVDSGILINGKAMKESLTENVSVEYIETQRSTLSMTTITVNPPFPETLPLFFEIVSTRNFEERPVVMRVRAYREKEWLGEEHGFVLGKEARSPKTSDGSPAPPRGFTVDALADLTEIPDTMLLHARADAWLMPEGTDESELNPLTDTAPDQVAILSNPVRINFIKAEDAAQ